MGQRNLLLLQQSLSTISQKPIAGEFLSRTLHASIHREWHNQPSCRYLVIFWLVCQIPSVKNYNELTDKDPTTSQMRHALPCDFRGVTQCVLQIKLSFTRVCDCRIFRILPHFSHISAKCAYHNFFCINWHFWRLYYSYFIFLCVSIWINGQLMRIVHKVLLPRNAMHPRY